jgi:two-component system nitrate/nitrite response regulator NarL
VTRILIADDHRIIISGLEALFRGTAYEVVGFVTEGTSVLPAVRLHRPDILILDVSMPDTNGVAVLKGLRSEGVTVPVVLLTASLDDGHLLEAMAAGVEGIVLKEGAHSQLLACLDAVSKGERWIDAPVLERWREATARGPAVRPLDGLTPRERQLAEMVGRGLRNREIGEALGISEGSVKVFLHRIYRKVGIATRTELALLAEQAAR